MQRTSVSGPQEPRFPSSANWGEASQLAEARQQACRQVAGPRLAEMPVARRTAGALKGEAEPVEATPVETRQAAPRAEWQAAQQVAPQVEWLAERRQVALRAEWPAALPREVRPLEARLAAPRLEGRLRAVQPAAPRREGRQAASLLVVQPREGRPVAKREEPACRCAAMEAWR